MEYEIKFSGADAEAFAALATSTTVAGYPAGPAKTRQFVDIYLDTADRRVQQAGYTCRLRQGDRDCLVTIKGLGSTDDANANSALHAREEVEAPATLSYKPVDWPDSAARELAMRLAGDAPLVELFRMQRVRTARLLGSPDEPVAELSLDEVEVELEGKKVEQYREVEAERIGSGSVTDLGRIAKGLSAMGLQPSPQSKFHRALALVEAHGSNGRQGHSLQGRKTRDDAPGVDRNDLLAEAARKILRFHLQKMLDNEAGVREGEEIEAVHRMRVATRRMRAAVRLFKPAFQPKTLKPYQDGLRATAGALGDVRDLDVLLLHLQEYREDQSRKRRDALEPLAEGWRSRRASLRVALVAHLDSDAYCEFVERFSQFLNTPGEGVLEQDPLELSGVEETKANPKVALGQVRVIASGIIWHRYEVVRAYGPAVNSASIGELHALRIETKYLRYALEFFVEVLGPKVRKLAGEVIALQDHLGDMHDAHVAAERVREFLDSEAHAPLDPANRSAIEAYIRSLEQQVRSLVKSAPRAWHEVGGADFRRRLVTTIAEL